MSRRLLAWGPAIPLMVAGVEAGHWVAYRLAYPDGYLRAQVLAQSGHGYLGAAPEVIGLAGAVGACVLIARAGRRGGAVSDPPPLLPFLLLAPCAFALQELVERGFAGEWPFAAVMTPTFFPGLAAQVPFAVLAFLIARWLVRAAEQVHGWLYGQPARRPVRLLLWRPVRRRGLCVPAPSALAAGWLVRGPPPAPAAF